MECTELRLVADDGDGDAGNSTTELDTASVEASFVLLMRWLHRQPEFTPEMLAEEEVQRFVRTHASLLDDAVDYTLRRRPIDDISVQRLKESNYVFSGFKTFHELNEAFPSLLDADGNRKPFERFLNDVQKVNETYNQWYLQAEYNFTLSSASMAAKWKQWWDDEDRDRYLLQYRTVGDRRVREAHRMLHNVTLPITSPFWDEYFPPNGWNCRCTVARVRKGKYPQSDEHQAMLAGNQATAGKHQEMMRFNPGKRMACFPAYNPYTISRCKDCPDRPGKLKLARVPKNELCAACKVIKEMMKAKESLQEQRKTVREWAKENLTGKTTVVNGISSPVEFTMNGIKETLNQPHKRVFAKNEAIKNIVSLLKDGTYIKECPEEKGNPMIRKYHYIKIGIANETSYAIIRELTDGRAQFYSIVEKLRE